MQERNKKEIYIPDLIAGLCKIIACHFKEQLENYIFKRISYEELEKRVLGLVKLYCDTVDLLRKIETGEYKQYYEESIQEE